MLESFFAGVADFFSSFSFEGFGVSFGSALFFGVGFGLGLGELFGVGGMLGFGAIAGVGVGDGIWISLWAEAAEVGAGSVFSVCL